jgi:thiamine-monophosphate kinase
MKHTQLGRGREFDLIRGFLREQPAVGAAHVLTGPGDDCAIVSAGAVAISVDMSVEGVHFRREWLTPEEIGWRATTAALSDIAAMAAAPIGVLVALAVKADEAGDIAPRIMHGCREAGAMHGAPIIGGDLTRSPDAIVIDIVVLGDAATHVLRSGARAGDGVWVTGSLGGAAAAVHAWQQGSAPSAAARAAYARPQARIAEARWLADQARLTSLIDLSDGLAGDADHLAAASGVGIVIDADAVPVHDAVRDSTISRADALRLAVAGGEDYELCFTADDADVARVADAFARRFGVGLSRVGRVEAGAGARIDGTDALHGADGFDHFGGAAP